MPIVSGGGGGSFNGGTITRALEIAAPAGAPFGPLKASYDGTVMINTQGGDVELRPLTGSVVKLDDGTGTPQVTVVTDRVYFGANSEWGSLGNAHGQLQISSVIAPADGDLTGSQMVIYFDATDGAAKLRVKAKQADGTVRTGSLALA